MTESLNDCDGPQLPPQSATVMRPGLSPVDDHYTLVPQSLLRQIEINIQTVKENLLRKQDLLTKVN